MATHTDNYNLVKPTMAETADIRTINGNMDSVDNIMHASQISLAPAYDQNETYNNGDVVMYEFLMYECLDDNVTGVWDTTKWQRTTAGEHGGGSDVEITPTLATGTKIADFEIDGVSGELYAPSGGGGAGYMELTQAEYNALTPAEKMNGTMYFITDAGGSGGGSAKIIDTLWSGAETPRYPTTYTANLSNSISNYDLLVFDGIETDYSQLLKYVIDTASITYNEVYLQIGDQDSGFAMTFIDDQTIELASYASSHPTTYTKITGLKFGGGGSSVIPNPQGTPTDTLNTIGIDGTIYDMAGSGGGGNGNGNGKVDLVYRAVDTSFVDIAFDISKYDLYIINASDSLLQSGETYTVTRETLKYYLDNSIAFCGWPYRGSSANALIQYLVTANGFEADDHALGFVITSIYGINTGTILAPMIYSEDEREVGCWIDNKPLYQKTFDLTSQALTDNAWNNNILGTTGISIKAYNGYFTLGTGTFFPYEYYRNNSEFFTVVTDINASDINVRPNMNAGTPVYAGVVTIWYTKDSDVAGSGSYGSLGVPMEHYDSTEKVVGTYFGETLYAKSYDIDNPSNNACIITEDFSDKIITDITAIGIRLSDGAIIPLQFTTTNNWMRVYAGTVYGGIYLESNITISNIKITVKYTKSST